MTQASLFGDYPEFDDLSPIGEVVEEDLAITDGDIQSMVVAPTDWTISVFIDLLRRGKIDMAPNYQRRIAWTEDKMSRFIESLFLRLPVPQVVLAETTPGRFAIIDGKQRVNSLARFCLDKTTPLILSNCDYRKDLNGLTYSAIEADQYLEASLDAFESHTIRTTVIKSIPNKEILYLLFLRLNQNSVSLSPQELRRALSPGPFMDWLDEKTASSKGMAIIFDKTPDFRMRDMEVATRHIAFELFANEYTGNMKHFLDFATQRLTSEWKAKELLLNGIWDEYENSIVFAQQVFGKNVFQFRSKGHYQRIKNRAVMDIITYYFAYPAVRARCTDLPAIKSAFENLCDHDVEFANSIQVTTKSKYATILRFKVWGRALLSTIGGNNVNFPSTWLDM